MTWPWSSLHDADLFDKSRSAGMGNVGIEHKFRAECAEFVCGVAALDSYNLDVSIVASGVAIASTVDG